MGKIKAGRMNEDIRRILSAQIRDLKDPRISGNADMLTVVRCDTAADGSFCKCYISCITGFDGAIEAVKGLENAKGLLRREISNVLHLKKAPDLKFIADDSVEYSVKINKILNSLNSEKAEPSSDASDDGSDNLR